MSGRLLKENIVRCIKDIGYDYMWDMRWLVISKNAQ